MSNTTTQVQFTIVDDELEVSAPLTLEPLDDFFETEIGTSDTMLDLVDHHVRHDKTWQLTGDACHLILDHETVAIEHIHTGARVTLSRTDLRALLADLRATLTKNHD
jgi:hypothetical protein